MEKFDIIGIGDADVDILVSVPHLPSYDEKVKGKILGQCVRPRASAHAVRLSCGRATTNAEKSLWRIFARTAWIPRIVSAIPGHRRILP